MGLIFRSDFHNEFGTSRPLSASRAQPARLHTHSETTEAASLYNLPAILNALETTNQGRLVLEVAQQLGENPYAPSLWTSAKGWCVARK